MRKSIQRNEAVINRIRRVPFVVFLKKILPVIIFLLLLFLSFVFGLWNVRSFEYIDSELRNVSTEELDSYLSEYIGRNIFLIKPIDIQKSILEGNGYVREVQVKKVLPSKLRITIKEFTPLYIGYSSDVCLLFADTGEEIAQICSECKQECTGNETELVTITSESILENNGKLIFYMEIYRIQKVLSVFNYQIVGIQINDGIAIFSDLEGHTFLFDISYELEEQLARMYLVGQKIDMDIMKFKSLDLRFERPVMK